jgi:hypothetical protein
MLNEKISHGRVIFGTVAVLLFVVSVQLISPAPGLAHSVFDDYINHRIDLKIDPNNIDVTVELFFHAHRSETERVLMDVNFDGSIMPAEIREYLSLVEKQIDGGIELKADGRSLPVIGLYGPELKLHNVDSVGDHPHTLRLYFFARTPEWLEQGSLITLEDNLWQNVPASCSLSVESKGPLHFVVQGLRRGALSPWISGDHRLIQIRAMARDHSQSERIDNEVDYEQGYNRQYNLPVAFGLCCNCWRKAAVTHRPFGKCGRLCWNFDVEARIPATVVIP